MSHVCVLDFRYRRHSSSFNIKKKDTSTTTNIWWQSLIPDAVKQSCQVLRFYRLHWLYMVFSLIMCMRCCFDFNYLFLLSVRGKNKKQISNSFSLRGRLCCLGFQLVWVWLTQEDGPMYGSIRGRHRGDAESDHSTLTCCHQILPFHSFSAISPPHHHPPAPPPPLPPLHQITWW